ncbi:MAG: pyridoxal phosphate-dependent aminotransferase [Acidobacteriota bacterium]
MKLSSRMSRITPSATLAVKQAAAELRARGESVVDFGPGEPDFRSPSHVVAAAKNALDRGETHYGASAGILSLRRGLAEALSRRSDRPVSFQNLLVTCGGKSAILYAMLALLEEGDEAVIPTPCWVSFPEQVRLAGARPVLVPCDPGRGFQPRIEDLEAAMTPRTRLLVINSPGNPTGAVMGRSEWERIVDLVQAHDVMLLSDETYLDFVYEGDQAPSSLCWASSLGEHLVLVGSFSKAYAMTGWRVGYAACFAERLALAMITLQSHDTTHPTTFAQHAALAALVEPDAGLERMKAEYAARRKLMLGGMEELPGFRCAPPGGAFYIFPDVTEVVKRTGCRDDVELAARLLREARVAVVPGTAFFAPGHLRLSYAVSRGDIREGLGRLKQWLGTQG